jgi:uncharacterized membrane protein YqgA involved in biofilm formation
VLAGALIGTVVGGRLPQAMHDRVLAGLGLVTLVLGVDLAWPGATRARCTCSAACCSAG